jgi:hypothetical protein
VSSDTYAAARGAFIAALRRAWHAAGKPSYQELELLSAQVIKRHLADEPELVQLATSTMQGILSEQRVRPPKWPRVLTFVVVLHEAARKAGADPARIGTVADWKRRHEQLCAAEMAARQLAGIGDGRPDSFSSSGEANPQAAALPDHLDDAEEDARLGEVLGLVRQAGEPQWWHEYRELVPDRLGFYLYLESIAKMIRMYKTQALPGLLQVEAYADALLRYVEPGASEPEIARNVELRMRRQQIIGSQGSCRLWAIVEEATLRNQYIGSPVMREQIRHLIEIAEQPNISLQILRDDRGDNDTLKEPLTVFRFAEPHVGDVAILGPRRPGGLVMHERKDVEHYNQVLSYLGTRACAAQDVQGTPALLRRILADT